MPPKKKGNRKGDDSDDEAIAALVNKLKVGEEMPLPGKKKGKGKGQDSDDEAAPAPKVEKKKKGKGRGDSDDEDEPAPAPSPAPKVDKKKKGKGRGDSDDEDAPAPAPSSKQDKKKKGKGRGDSDDEDEAAPAPAPSAKQDKKKKGKGRGDSDDEDAPAPAPAPSSKQDKKKKGKGREDSDDEDVPPPAPAPVVKQDKKKSKGKGRGDSDDDEDPLQKMRQLAVEDDEDEQEDEEDAMEIIKKAKKDKKKDKKAKQQQQVEATEDDQPEDEEEVVEEASTPVKVPQPSPTAAVVISPPAPVAPIPEAVESQPEPEADAYDSDTPIKGSTSTSKAKMSKAERKRQKSAAKSSATHQTVVPTASDEPEYGDDGEQQTVQETPAVLTETAPPRASAPSTASLPVEVAPAPAPAGPPKPKSKLQLKLERLQQEKEEREKAQAAEKAAQAADAAAAAAAASAAALAASSPAPQVSAPLTSLSSAAAPATTPLKSVHSVAPVSAVSSSSASTAAPAPMDADAHARMLSTMYGDEVHSEYGPGPRAVVGSDDDADEEAVATGSSKKKERLTNKAKKKAQKEAEAKERELEYNRAALQRSIEGAQFACSQSIIDPNDPQWQNALDIIIPSLSISAHNKELFYNAELNIVHGRRYGLVGPNGAGKSTLLKMISSGELKVPPRVDYLYVEQEVLADDTPAVDAVLKADKRRWELLTEEKQLMKDIEQFGATDERDDRLGALYEELEVIGAHSAEAKARRILFGLGFDEEMQVRPTKYFSGGWRMRISLARALFIEPTLLMLDEPTNHLDLNAVIWLDDYLQKWKKTLLVVSHDQDFLNSVCEEIIHLDDKKLIVYKGNYDTFKEQERVKLAQQLKAWERQEKKIRENKMKGMQKSKAEEETKKAKAREPGARSLKKLEAKAAASGGLESGESQVELIKRPREYNVKFSFPEVVSIPPPILEVRDVNFRYGPHLPWLFRGVNFGLDMGSRVCIVGPNGSGKSTLIKLITEEVKPPEGEVRRNPRLRVGVYNQHFVDRLPMDEDPVTYLRRLFNDQTYQSCRNLLGSYGLEGHAHTIPIRDLSGGQKARVVFVELSLMAPHLLFLDEPTNNLDIESIDALCDALRAYNGGVVLVSHDARLIESTECQLWVVEDQGVHPWIEGFANYRTHLLKKLEEQLALIIPGGGERPADKEKQRREERKLASRSGSGR